MRKILSKRIISIKKGTKHNLPYFFESIDSIYNNYTNIYLKVYFYSFNFRLN